MISLLSFEPSSISQFSPPFFRGGVQSRDICYLHGINESAVSEWQFLFLWRIMLPQLAIWFIFFQIVLDCSAPYFPKISFFWSCGAAVRFFRMFFLAFPTLWRPSVLVLFPSCVDATHPWFGCDPVVRGSSELKPLRHRAPVLEFCWVGCLIFGSPDVLLLVAKSLALFG